MRHFPAAWLTLVLALAAVAPAQDGEQPLTADPATVGLWRFDGEPAGGFKELSGRSADAVVNPRMPDVTLLDAPAQLPKPITRVARVDRGQIIMPGVMQKLANGPFTIEWRGRFRRSEGLYLLQQESSNRLGITLQDRDAGTLQFRYRGGSDKDKPAEKGHKLYGVFEHTGPWTTTRFHHVAVTFDGQRTLDVLLDGQSLARFQLPEGQRPALTGKDLLVGDGGRFNQSVFDQIAEVRVSNVARTFSPRASWRPAKLAEALARHAVRLDLNAAESPTAEGHLALSCGQPAPDAPVGQTLTGDLEKATYSPERGYGWLQAPAGAFDSWFTGAGVAYKPEDVIAKNERHVADWHLRDGHLVNDGATLRVDLPPGRYEVVVHVGQPWKNQTVDAIQANHVMLGKQLISYAEYWRVYPVDRSARGIVDVKDAGLQIRFHGSGPMGVLGLEAYPYAPPPVRRVEGRLVGNDPASLEQVNQAYAQGKLAQAAKAAQQISDPLTRCAAVAWVLGYPASPADWHHEALTGALADLDRWLHEHPLDDVAASLRRSMLYLDDVLTPATGRGLTDRLAAGPHMRRDFEAADQALQVLPEEPVFGQCQFVAGTLLFWAARESGKTNEKMPDFETNAMRAVHALYPEARLPRIYLGEKLSNVKQIAVPAGAPAWAGLQHRLLTRIVDVHDWWVNVKQDQRGLLGGGYGDDVEATRSWPVSILIADREDVRSGWRKLTDFGWTAYPHVYREQMMDIEHGSEDFADSHMFPIFFEYGTPRHEVLMGRALQSWQMFRDVWSHKNAQGFRVLKSGKMSSTEVNMGKPGSSAYGLRMLAPAMYNLYFSRDPEHTKLLLEYADGWREAAMAQRSGKPSGIVPVWVEPDGSPGYNKNQWWSGLIRIPYPIPAYYIYDCLLAAYDLTGDAKYLEPIEAGVKLLRENPLPPGTDVTTLPEGSLLWALYTPHPKYADFYGEAFITAAAATARRLSGRTDFDDVLLTRGHGAIRTRVALEKAGDESARRQAIEPLIAQFQRDLDVMDYNIEMYTTEVRRTDRIYLQGVETLMAMATSDTGTRGRTNSIWPTYALSWRGTGTDIAMMITREQPTGATVALYNLAPQPKKISARFWRLQPGTYDVRLTPSTLLAPTPGTQPVFQTRFEYKNLGDEVELTLPPGQELVLSVAAATAPSERPN